MPDEDDDRPDAAAAQARGLVDKWKAGEPWDADEIEVAEVLLKRLRRGAEPHADLVEALDANRTADGAPPYPTPT